jgi:hypothetical protein
VPKKYLVEVSTHAYRMAYCIARTAERIAHLLRACQIRP